MSNLTLRDTRPLNAVQENQPYLRNRKAYELQTWYTDGVRCPALRTCGLIAKVKVTRRLKVGVEVTTCRGRDILWQPHYRLHSLFAFRGCDLWPFGPNVPQVYTKFGIIVVERHPLIIHLDMQADGRYRTLPSFFFGIGKIMSQFST